jgi:hypothetical protein
MGALLAVSEQCARLDHEVPEFQTGSVARHLALTDDRLGALRIGTFKSLRQTVTVEDVWAFRVADIVH